MTPLLRIGWIPGFFRPGAHEARVIGGRWRSMPCTVLAILVAAGGGAEGAAAQSFPVRAVPDATTEWSGLVTLEADADVTAAVGSDPLEEHFRNPAIGAGGPLLRATVAPRLYGDHWGTLEGRALPAAVLLSSDRFFGGVAFGYEDVQDAPRRAAPVPSAVRDSIRADPAENSSIIAGLGVRPASFLSFGASVHQADLGLHAGVRRSYPEALAVTQEGERRGVTLGAALALPQGRSLDLAVGRSDLEMTHEVVRWEMAPAEGGGLPHPVATTDLYEDRAREEHARLRYHHPFPELWSEIGILLGTYSRRQLETPAFDLVNVPRNPGTSRFYELGLGIRSGDGVAVFNAEIAYAPGTRSTRTLADEPKEAADGTPIERGDATVEHDFAFDNWRVEGGMEVQQGRVLVDAGIGGRRYAYTLEQVDRVNLREHRTRESFIEWSASLGISVDVGRFELGYGARVVARGIAPCSPHSYRPRCDVRAETFRGSTVQVEPSSPDAIPDVQTFMHGPTVRLTLGG